MNPELKVIIYEQKNLFKNLIKLLDEQYEFIVNKEVTKMDKIAKNLENLSRDIAKLEIQRRNLVGANVKMSSLIAKCDDDKVKEAYEEIKESIRMIEIQKEANQMLLKQRLFFTKKMINVIKPNQGVGTYNSYGQVGK